MTREEASRILNYLKDKACSKAERVAISMALTALRAQQEQIEPECDFCTEDKDGYVKKMGAFSISEPFHKGEYYLRTKHCKPRKINFCPMCGRKLGGTVFLTREEAEAALRREQDG